MPRIGTSVRILIASALAVFLSPFLSAFTIVTLPVGDNPGALDVIPQTGELAVVNSGTNDVSIVDPLTLHVSTVRAGLMPTGIVVCHRIRLRHELLGQHGDGDLRLW